MFIFFEMLLRDARAIIEPALRCATMPRALRRVADVYYVYARQDYAASSVVAAIRR